MVITTAHSTAGLDRVWAALTEVGTWPQWTKSITSVEPLGPGSLEVGHRFKVKQPGFPASVWEVTEVREREAFTWVSSMPGVRTSGVHRLTSEPDGSVTITLELEQSGALAGIVRALTGRRTRRYVEMEAAGLKAASEAR